MAMDEQKAQQEGRVPTRASGEKDMGIKSFEKDSKSLNKFFVERRLFIHTHMVFKKLVPSCPGTAFTELAKFYFQMANSPGLHKLHKDVLKKTDYKVGITTILGMFNSSENTDVTSANKISPSLGAKPISKPNSVTNKIFGFNKT